MKCGSLSQTLLEKSPFDQNNILNVACVRCEEYLTRQLGIAETKDLLNYSEAVEKLDRLVHIFLLLLQLDKLHLQKRSEKIAANKIYFMFGVK